MLILTECVFIIFKVTMAFTKVDFIISLNLNLSQSPKERYGFLRVLI